MKPSRFVQTNVYPRSDNFFSTYPTNIFNPTQQDGYVIGNGTAALSSLDRKITIAAYVHNLFDQHLFTNIFDLPLAGPDDLGQFVTCDDRTVGVQVACVSDA